MTANEFRKLALSLPETAESAHMGHPDFRVGGKIFATLGHAGKGSGMVKLTPPQQAEFVAAEPEVFEPVSGGWGRQGATTVHLAGTTEDVVRRALVAAWRNTARKRVGQQFEDDECRRR
jgi:hypothetical protein